MTNKKQNLQEIEDPNAKYYEPKPEGEKRFWLKHIIAKHLDRVGNGDNVYSATNIGKDHTRRADNGVDVIPPHDQMEETKTRVIENFVSNLKKKEQLTEDPQGATSDNPAGSSDSIKVGGIDQQDRLDKDNDTATNQVKQTLESIALQTAEMYDMIKRETRLETWAQDKLSIAQNNLAELYTYISEKSKGMNTESTLGEIFGLGKKPTTYHVQDSIGMKVSKHNTLEDALARAKDLSRAPSATRKNKYPQGQKHSVIDSAGKRYYNESYEYEPLEELSRTVLKGYVKKASRIIPERGGWAGATERGRVAADIRRKRNLKNRRQGVASAEKRLEKVDKPTVSESKEPKKPKPIKSYEVGHIVKPMVGPHKGQKHSVIDSAGKRYYNESYEYEPLEELSTDTLGRYRSMATADRNWNDSAEKAQFPLFPKNRKILRRNVDKRNSGITKATNKLYLKAGRNKALEKVTNEEIILESKGEEKKPKPIKSYEVGHIVKPMVGPHKGQNHRIIHVYPHSDTAEPRYNIAPVGWGKASQIKYKLGAASCYHSQLYESNLSEDVTVKVLEDFNDGYVLVEFSDKPEERYIVSKRELEFRAIKEEPLQELSKKTVISYLGKSGHQSDELRARSQSFPGTMSSAKSLLTPDEEKTRQKRLRGQWSGVSRLTTNKYKKYTTEEDNEFDPEDQELLEVITGKTSVGDVIHDFVHSDNSKFKGDSKKQRIHRALGTWYGMHKEEFESLDEMTRSRVLQAIEKGFKTYRATADPSGTASDHPTIKKINRIYDHLKKRRSAEEPHLLRTSEESEMNLNKEEQDYDYGAGMQPKPNTIATSKTIRGKKKVSEDTFVPNNDGGNQNNSGADLQNGPDPYSGNTNPLAPENPRTKQRRYKRNKIYLKPSQKPIPGPQNLPTVKLTTEEDSPLSNNPASTNPGLGNLGAKSKNKKVVQKPLDQEEVLHELSKKTLGSYVKKAHDSAQENLSDYRDDDDANFHYSSYRKKYLKNIVKRTKGINRAADKLAKEEVQHVEEGTHRYNSFGQWVGNRIHPAGPSSSSSELEHSKKIVADALAGKNTRAQKDKAWRAKQDAAWAAKKKSQNESLEEVNVGDNVHLGFGSKGGAGFRGKVIKIDGDTVHIQSHHAHDTEAYANKWGPKTYKGLMKHVTKEEVEPLEELDYSAKKAAAGKDIGKPGKNFSKIAKSAGAKYGSKEAGQRVAGAILNRLRHK